MNNSLFSFPQPENEKIKQYESGSIDREKLKQELNNLSKQITKIPLIIGGKEVFTDKTGEISSPHKHKEILAIHSNANKEHVEMAIDAALEAKKEWENISWVERASIMLKAADLISKKYRYQLVAATMLGQGKSVYQAEIDAACETIDFLRYNVFFASKLYADQPKSDSGQLNRIEYRSLEGFVFTVSPFNFTAIASNLNMSVVMMGNTTVWKPASTSLLSNYLLMKIFKEAGLPDGVINFVPGSGPEVAEPVLNHRFLAGIHFTGSNATFNTLWKTVSENLEKYRSYPKLVGETGGKDFIFVHNSADKQEVATAIVRGAFEYQGQKCSAASRAYIPKSLWTDVKEIIQKQTSEIKIGDVKDFSNFMNAVIDKKSFDKIISYINQAKESDECTIITGGDGDSSEGYFINPTIIETNNPCNILMQEEIFGPVITVYVYDDDMYEETLKTCERTSLFGLTGTIFANDRYAMVKACKTLKYAAGNFYINDKPTGAVVGMQPFGGSRQSGTNDKAGGSLNLLRWVSPRTIKETFIPDTDFKYPYMD